MAGQTWPATIDLFEITTSIIPNPGFPLMEYFLFWRQIYQTPSYGIEYWHKYTSMSLTIPLANYTILQPHVNTIKPADSCLRTSGQDTAKKWYWYALRMTDFTTTINNVQRPPVLEPWANPLLKYFMKSLASTQFSILAISFCLYGAWGTWVTVGANKAYHICSVSAFDADVITGVI